MRTERQGVAKAAAALLDGRFSSPAITVLLPQSLASSTSCYTMLGLGPGVDVTCRLCLNSEKEHRHCNHKMSFQGNCTNTKV